MLDAAKRISHYLNGILLDSSRNLLTSEKVTHINELLASYTNDAEEDVF